MKPIKTLTLTAMALAFGQAFGQASPNDSVGAWAYWALPPGQGANASNNYTVYYDGKSLVFKENIPGGKEGIVNPQLAVNAGQVVQTPPPAVQAFDWNGFIVVNGSFFGTNTNALGNIGYNVTVSSQTLATSVNNGSMFGTAVLNGQAVNVNRSNDLVYGGKGEGFSNAQPGVFKVYTSANADTSYGGYIQGRALEAVAPDGVPVASYLSVGVVNFPASAFVSYQAPYVSGIATTAAQIATLGNVSATYTGKALATPGMSVNMNVNFGSATWSGTYFYGSSVGVYQSNGTSSFFNPSFQVTGGSISGANFTGSASQYGGGLEVRSGTVSGNFVGPAAQGLIGQANVNFAYGYGSVTFKDAFWALKQVRR